MKRTILVVMFFLMGCATKPVGTFHTYNTLHIHLSKKDPTVYTLIDSRDRAIARSSGSSGALNFSIPSYANTSSCFYILDEKGKSIFEPNPYFGLPLSDRYKTIYATKNQLDADKHRLERMKNDYQNRYENAWRRLKSNRAFKDNTCYLPPRKPFSKEPYTKCSSENECLEEGAAICFSRFFGTEGCGIALKEFNIPGLLSAPSCAAVAAGLAGEKYGMDDALVDFLHGLVDDVAHSLIQSETGSDQFWGYVIKGGNYILKIDKAIQCTNSFVEYYYGPKLRWMEEVQRIKNEPVQTRNKCYSIIDEVNHYYEKIDEIDKKERVLKKDIEAVDVEYQQSLKNRNPIVFCR